MSQQREPWLTSAVGELRPIFEAHNFPLPEKIRVTCGFPSKFARAINRAMGEWHPPSSSADGHHEIFISPVESDPWSVLGTLVHELCHSATPDDGHRGCFPALAKKMHLEGKPSATRIGKTFKQEFASILETLGEYPHANLDVTADNKTQSTRMLKVVCPTCIEHYPDGRVKWQYSFRMSQYTADKGTPTCPCGTQTQLA